MNNSCEYNPGRGYAKLKPLNGTATNFYNMLHPRSINHPITKQDVAKNFKLVRLPAESEQSKNLESVYMVLPKTKKKHKKISNALVPYKSSSKKKVHAGTLALQKYRAMMKKKVKKVKKKTKKNKKSKKTCGGKKRKSKKDKKNLYEPVEGRLALDWYK